jgi:purine nucleosidase
VNFVPSFGATICYPASRENSVLIDTDTASDDAVALIMALRSPVVQVVAITTLSGNVDIHQASRENAIYAIAEC